MSTEEGTTEKAIASGGMRGEAAAGGREARDEEGAEDPKNCAMPSDLASTNRKTKGTGWGKAMKHVRQESREGNGVGGLEGSEGSKEYARRERRESCRRQCAQRDGEQSWKRPSRSSASRSASKAVESIRTDDGSATRGWEAACGEKGVCGVCGVREGLGVATGDQVLLLRHERQKWRGG